VSKKTPTKPRKTRLKGTPTTRPCFDCGKIKNRFKDFKPRWAGCADHKSERGRRYHEPGCDACEKIVNGNIRQPRCIECDAKRPKKRRKAKQAAAPAPQATPTPAPTPEPVAAEPEPTPVVVEPTPEPEPVATVATPEPEDAPAEDATPVSVPAPKPEKKARPKIASKADLFKLLESGLEESE
jgi:hypothetical protein